MQISKVSFGNKINQINKIQTSSNLSSYTFNKKAINPADIFKYYSGRDMVSFGLSNINSKYNEEYFQLPKEYSPDSFQIDAGRAISEGKDLLVEAPTGTGKTAIAHYAASKNMAEGKTTFYTTPLKALSNQKLNEFRAVYGDENVGILTGDRRENTNAPIIIMTTEVYRNMALSNMYGEKNPLMQNLGTVIFDEFHYLGDDSRGPVWEESAMLTPKDVQILELSATIGNSSDMQKWGSALKGKQMTLISIPPTERAVPLEFDKIYTTAYKEERKHLSKHSRQVGINNDNMQPAVAAKPNLSDFNNAVQLLNKEKKLPAIFFVFSRKYSRDLLEYFGKEGKNLTSNEEKKEIDKIVKRYKSQGYIGDSLDINALKKGYAIHNAGIIPRQKELIEELFQKKLIKVVLATETLAAGINMPAKTVVISSPYKPSDNPDDELGMRQLTANEFKQMAGRAGRRGIDTQGYVYTMPVNIASESLFSELQYTGSNPLKSQYKPDYAFLTGYYEHNDDESALRDYYKKTFFAYSPESKTKNALVDRLMKETEDRTTILDNRNFVQSDNDKINVTTKGKIASKVRGYDAISLTEAMTGGKFADMTPETLALIAGSIANPVKRDSEQITEETHLEDVIGPTHDYVQNLYTNIRESVALNLKKLGLSLPENPDEYEQILETVKGIEKSDIDVIELEERVNSLKEILEKLSIIRNTNAYMTEDELASELQKGNIIPSSVLEEHYEAVESYKRQINSSDIDEYIKRLNGNLNSVSSSAKGKKAKAKTESKRSEINKEIKYARLMKYLDENIADALNSNSIYVKNHPVSKTHADYKRALREYARTALKDAIENQLSALIELDKYDNFSDLYSERKYNINKANSCLGDMINISNSVYEEELNMQLDPTPLNYGKPGAQILYNWAFLNKISSDSMSNWHELINMAAQEDMDEGSIYRSIMQTSDLLGQMIEMAEAGIENSYNEDEFEYYTKIRENAAKARELIIKYPIEV